MMEQERNAQLLRRNAQLASSMMDQMLNVSLTPRIARVDFLMTELELIVSVMLSNVSKIYISAMELTQSVFQVPKTAHWDGSMMEQEFCVLMTLNNVSKSTSMMEVTQSVSQTLTIVQ